METCTFQSTPRRLHEWGLGDKVRDINIAAQYLETAGDLGYVVLDADLGGQDSGALLAQISALEGTIGARLVFESNRPIAHVARDLGVPSETLRKHVRQVEADEGGRPDLPTAAEREEIKQLRRENYELRRANEILKAASVFFATELDTDRTK